MRRQPGAGECSESEEWGFGAWREQEVTGTAALSIRSAATRAGHSTDVMLTTSALYLQ